MFSRNCIGDSNVYATEKPFFHAKKVTKSQRLTSRWEALRRQPHYAGLLATH